MSPKRIEITQEMIDQFVPGCSVNNPIVYALKTQCFPNAREIILHGDEIYVDKVLITPTTPLVRWGNDWHKGRKVKPSILGYHEP